MTYQPRRKVKPQGSLARGLAWFSIGLGAVEILAPRLLARTLGMQGKAPLIRAYGMREMAAGLGILSQKNPKTWLWGRVAGDVIDLATLAPGLGKGHPKRKHTMIAIGAVAGVALLDLLSARAAERKAEGQKYVPDYRLKTGFPSPPAQMRGVAKDVAHSFNTKETSL